MADAVECLGHEFREAVSSVFAPMSGVSCVLLAATEESTSGQEDDRIVYSLLFSGGISGNMWVHLNQHSAAALVEKFTGMPNSSHSELEDALTEIMGQVSGVMASSLRRFCGTAEIRAERCNYTQGAAGRSITFRIVEFGSSFLMTVYLDSQLLASTATAMLSSSTPSSLPAKAADPGAYANQPNLDLIMDVELEVTLRFGQRTLTLREVADLTTGSVIELDRVVDEPVELLLGDRVIAQGEVVIVDGNYGLRVTELAANDRRTFLSA